MATAWTAPPTTGSALARDVRPHAVGPTGGCLEVAWPLHTGRNTFQARPFNLAGHRDIESKLVLEVE